MALVATTLASACSATATKIVVASATSIAKGYQIKIDGEIMVVSKAYVSGSTTVPVLRGQDGGNVFAHPVTSAVYHGAVSDSEWSTQAPQTSTNFPIAGKALTFTSYSASGAITLPTPGSDALAVLNAVSTTVLEMTVALPSKAMDGCRLTIASRNGTGAHTVTIAGRLNGAPSGNYTILTWPAGPVCVELIALDEFWYAPSAPVWTGTMTLLGPGVS